MKVKTHRVSLILSLLAFVVATGFCALLLWEADAFEYSFLKVARHDMRLRTEDVMLAHMRPKLGAWAVHIETARGIGYRFVP